MNGLTLEALNNTFSWHEKDSSLRFSLGPNEIPIIEIKNQQATARIGLQGAHLLSWIPRGHADVLWLSKNAVFAKGKALRGGIPICWPWFGAHAENADYPAHGFARTARWNVISARVVSAAETELVMALDTSQIPESLQRFYPYSTFLEYRLLISDKLSLQLETTNNGAQMISVSQALHSYFNITDIEKTSIFGLDNKIYLDKTLGYEQKRQSGPIVVTSEVDRIYLDTDDDVIIDNGTRKITISKQGSATTVVWNPWKNVAKNMQDFDDYGYRQMICIESANVGDDIVQLKAGQQHSLFVTYVVSM